MKKTITIGNDIERIRADCMRMQDELGFTPKTIAICCETRFAQIKALMEGASYEAPNHDESCVNRDR